MLVPPLVAPSSAHAAAAVAPGSQLVFTDLPLIDGGTFAAADPKRKLVVVYWWASWCPFCAEMTPSVEKLWLTHRAQGLAVLGVSIDKTVEAAREHRRKRGYTFPSTMADASFDASWRKPPAVPVLWVADRAGRVVMAENGQLFPEDVAEIKRFL